MTINHLFNKLQLIKSHKMYHIDKDSYKDKKQIFLNQAHFNHQNV